MAEYARHVLRSTVLPLKNKRAVTRLHGIHFFGLSQISPFHLQLLSRLKSYFDIRIYSLNPSREYWEDIKTPLKKNGLNGNRSAA
jgi:exonuclease V gamma subunit